MTWFEPVTLRGRHATLEPLGLHHVDGMKDAVKDGELWTLWYTHTCAYGYGYSFTYFVLRFN